MKITKILPILLLSFILASCEKDEDEDDGCRLQNIEKYIVGKWVRISTHGYETASRYIFSSDGTYIFFSINEYGVPCEYNLRAEGTYTVYQSELRMSVAGSTFSGDTYHGSWTSHMTIIELTRDVLVFIYDGTGGHQHTHHRIR